MPKVSHDGPKSAEPVLVPFERVASLVRQLTHDFRNGLNTLDLQAAYLQELVTDPEVLPEVKRIRTMVAVTAKMLQSFSANFWIGEAQPVTYSASMLVEDFRARLATLLPEKAAQIVWSEELGDESISVDIELLFRALSEFFKNAFQFQEKGREIAARFSSEDECFVLELREGKSALSSPPETWGREPLVSTRRGAFGMGLFHTRRILALHEGTLDFAFDPAAELLITRVTIPLAAA